MMRGYMLMVWAAALVLLCGCEVHQFPVPKRGTMILHLHYEPDFWVWDHLYEPLEGIVVESHPDEGVDETHPGTSDRYNGACDSGTARIVVRAYDPDNLYRVLKEFYFTHDISTGYDCYLELDLNPGDYVLAVWSDLYEGSTGSPFYNPDNFRKVALLYSDNYRANTDYRDGYRGRKSIKLKAPDSPEAELEQFDVTMRRPMGKFEFITTDLSEFLERETTRRKISTRARLEDYTVIIQYTGYLPCSYSVIEDRLENATSGVQFVSQVNITGESEASLGFDYVMINNIAKGSVLAMISVYDAAGELVAQSRQISVPLRRDHHTVMRGAFLSGIAHGGVGIDPGYEGDHNVTYP